MASIAPIQKRVTVTTVAGRTAEGEAELTISTGSLDREHDELVPEGCDLRNYQRNPVVLYGHQHYQLPVGVCTSISIEGTGIRAAWRWLRDDPFAERVRSAYAQGVLRAASVGFQPLEWTPNEHGGYRFTKWELLEWSLVNVPAQPEAVRTLKSLGLSGPPAVAHLSVLLQQLTGELKSGQVLSTGHEQRLQEATRGVTEVLAELHRGESRNDDSLPTHILINGQPVALTPDMLKRAIAGAVQDGVLATVGPQTDGPAIYVQESHTVVRMSEEQLTALIVDGMRDALMKVTGRID